MHNELPVLRLEDQLAQQGEMTISDMARVYSLSLRTLRFYEDKDLLHPRRQGTARFYSVRDRIRLELILKGKKLGFTLAEIYDLIVSREKESPSLQSSDGGSDLTVSLDKKQITNQIAHLERQRADLDSAIAELQRAHHRLEATSSLRPPIL